MTSITLGRDHQKTETSNRITLRSNFWPCPIDWRHFPDLSRARHTVQNVNRYCGVRVQLSNLDFGLVGIYKHNVSASNRE